MRLFKLILLFILTLNQACKTETKKAKQNSNFSYIEISYSNGWTEEMTFYVDSNFILFSPVDSNKIGYAQLSDTVKNILDSCIHETILDNNLQSHNAGCIDCEIIVFSMVTKKDTLHLIQTGQEINDTLIKILRTLDAFRNTHVLDTINGQLTVVTSLVPPKKPMVRFVRPKMK